jgi:hypothetical protein
MKGRRAIFSSESVNWRTPQALYSRLNEEFKFTLDPCPIGGAGGLERSWKGERVYCNPPYGAGVLRWLRKSREADLAVYLLPARTDTVWFHGWGLQAEEVRFLKRRLRFGGENDAPFPSLILVFRNRPAGDFPVPDGSPQEARA